MLSRCLQQTHIPLRPSLRLPSLAWPGRHYATHRDLPSRPSSYRPGSGYTFTTLLRPFAFAVLFTGSSFAAAHYLGTTTSSSSDPDASLKVLTGLIALNALVFAGHQVPPTSRILGTSSLTRLLARYGHLDLTTVSRRPVTLVTSGFSHRDFWHLGLNMVGLYTVGSALFGLLGPGQFMACYGSAICWSGMAQLMLEVTRAKRGVMPRPSLGASGGVYALLGLVAWYAPSSSVYLIFLPFIPIKLGYAFTGMMTLDAVGIARGWSTYGHAAHLAGGASGFLYGAAGVPESWMRTRREALRGHLRRYGR